MPHKHSLIKLSDLCSPEKLIKKKDPDILELQKVLEEKTGLNISIMNKKNNSGTISFNYQNIDQLDKIIEVIKKNY